MIDNAWRKASANLNCGCGLCGEFCVLKPCTTEVEAHHFLKRWVEPVHAELHLICKSIIR